MIVGQNKVKKTIITGIVCFIIGAALALLIVIPLMLADAFESTEYIRTEKRIVYDAEGKIKEARLSFPTFEEYYHEISTESGFSILTEDLPKTSNSSALTNITWESVIQISVPVGYESVLVAPKTYKIQKKKPNQQLEPTSGLRPAAAHH